MNQQFANMNMGAPTYQGELDLDNLPPPPPELLQQQYLYGSVPDSRQQGAYSQFAQPQGQVSYGYTPGEGSVSMPAPQKAAVTNAPPSKPIQVRSAPGAGLLWLHPRGRKRVNASPTESCCNQRTTQQAYTGKNQNSVVDSGSNSERKFQASCFFCRM